MTPISSLAAALELAQQDYAVFPCRADKRPVCPHGFQDATTDPEGIECLWAKFPGELVGVATGRASLVAVLDIDAKHKEARDWYAERRDFLLPTRVHRTRSGGLHLIFGHEDGLKCSAARIARGVDVRAEGGYVIWWPGAGLPVLSDAPIAPWPDWITAKLSHPTVEAQPIPAPADVCRLIDAARDLRPALHRVQGLIRTVIDAREGERNRVLFWAVCRTRDMFVAGELDHPSARELLEALRGAALRAGLPVRETERTITSAMRAAA
jgi:hypothetical protein